MEAKEKLASAVKKMDARAEKLEATIEGYAQAKAVCSSGATDVDSSLAVVLRADMDAGGRTGNEDYGLSVEDIEKISSALSSLEAGVPDDVEANPGDLEDNPDSHEDNVDAPDDKPLDLDTGTADVETSREPDTQTAPDDADTQVIADTEKADAQVIPDIEDTDVDVELAPSPFDEEFIEEAQGYPSDMELYRDEILGPDEDYIAADMDAYKPLPYDGPAPVTEDDWKSAQLEHFRESIYGLQTEGYYQKINITNDIQDLGYQEFDLQPDWLYENLGDDVADVLADYNGMKATIESIDQRMDATDAYIELLDNPDISDDDKLAAFDRMAGKMGFTEEMLETVYISRPEETPDVDIQTDDNAEAGTVPDSPLMRMTPSLWLLKKNPWAMRKSGRPWTGSLTRA